MMEGLVHQLQAEVQGAHNAASSMQEDSQMVANQAAATQAEYEVAIKVCARMHAWGGVRACVCVWGAGVTSVAGFHA